jgi:pilus assembly protein CpaC
MTMGLRETIGSRLTREPDSLAGRGLSWPVALAVAGALCLGLMEYVRAEPNGEESATKQDKARRSKTTRDQTEVEADKRTLLLAVGEQKAVDLDFETELAKVYIGNPQLLVFDLVKVGDKQQMIFRPTKAGDTTVLVRDMDGELRLIFKAKVTGSNLSRLAGEIRQLLADIEGVDVKIVGQKIVIDGEVLTPSDYARVLAVTRDDSYRGAVLPLITLSAIAMQVLSRRIQEDLRTFAPDVTTRVVNNTIWLEGEVGSPEDVARAEKIAALYVPEVLPSGMLDRYDENAQRLPPRSMIQNFLRVKKAPPPPLDKLIRVTVYFVELSKDYNRLFSFKWQPSFTAAGEPQIAIGQREDGTAGASGTSFSAVISSLIPKLQTLQQAGYARVLKTGTLIAKSGSTATLREQTEFASLVERTNEQGVTQIAAQKTPVGLSIQVLPRVLGQTDDIEMDIDMTQSTVVGTAPAGDRAPTVAANAITTKFYLKSNDSAAFAGVSGQEVGTDFNKAPLAADPLFRLNRSKEYKKKNSRFVVFVTPQIIESASQGTEDLKRDFRVRAN